MSNAPAEDGAERPASAPAFGARLLAVATVALLSAAAFLGLSVACREAPSPDGAPSFGESLTDCPLAAGCAGAGTHPVILPAPAGPR